MTDDKRIQQCTNFVISILNSSNAIPDSVMVKGALIDKDWKFLLNHFEGIYEVFGFGIDILNKRIEEKENGTKGIKKNY